MLVAALIAGFNIQSDVMKCMRQNYILNSFVRQSHASCDVAMELNIEETHVRQLFESCATPPRHTESVKLTHPKNSFSDQSGKCRKVVERF